jgi:hypothetical protein
MKQAQLYIIIGLLVSTFVFYLLWRKQVHINTQIVTEQTLKLNESELQVRELVGEIRIIKERREMRDSLLLINQKKRQDEKIKLLQSFGGTLTAQNDSSCYSFDENLKIAEMLIDGANCQIDLIEVRKSYEDMKLENRKNEGMVKLQAERIDILNSKITQQEKKIKRRNVWLWITSTLTLLTVAATQ